MSRRAEVRTMSRAVYIFTHALAAGAFMFFLQTLALQTTARDAVPVALIFALAAAGLAWHQGKR